MAQQSTRPTGDTTTPTPPAPAGLAPRFGALLVDWILCVLAAGLFSHPSREAWTPSLVLIAEYAFFIGVFGQTPGMWLARIRCVSVTTEAAVGIPRAALRGLLLTLLVPPLVMDGARRGWHDKAAGTIVLAGRTG
ncbi:MAG TPA: RDD family protein [Rugosimonospora sp.]|nr:RDD family protein [Rugosimonospora sp.]